MNYFIGLLLVLIANPAFCSPCENIETFRKTGSYDLLVKKGMNKVVQQKLAHLAEPAFVSLEDLSFSLAPSKNRHNYCRYSSFSFHKGKISIQDESKYGLATNYDNTYGCADLRINKVYDTLGNDTGKTRCELTLSEVSTEVYNETTGQDIAYIKSEERFIFDANIL